MGLLDDAIREHLELKRRHGADPGEVAKQEQEALGPARRGPEPLEVAAGEAGEAATTVHQASEASPQAPADAALIEAQVDAPIYHEPEEHHGSVAMGETRHEVPEPAAEPPAPPVTPERSEPLPRADEADVEWEAPEPEPEPEPASPAEGPPSAGQPTVAFDAADVEEAQRRPDREPEPAPEPREPAGPDEDVLEETPDFLQETPEHDRLWFEQRPPRDFDFDG